MHQSSQSELRKSARDSRRRLDAQTIDEFSARIQRRFLRSRWFLSAGRIGCYFALPEEVGTSEIFHRAWRAGKEIFAPVVQRGCMRFVPVRPETPLVRNRFGIYEPLTPTAVPPKTLDVVIVPVVAFDDHGHRIGMGGGYYDRTFRFLLQRDAWLQPKLLGVAFGCQRVDRIAPNPWDVSLDTILTED